MCIRDRSSQEASPQAYFQPRFQWHAGKRSVRKLFAWSHWSRLAFVYSTSCFVAGFYQPGGRRWWHSGSTAEQFSFLGNFLVWSQQPNSPTNNKSCDLLVSISGNATAVLHQPESHILIQTTDFVSEPKHGQPTNRRKRKHCSIGRCRRAEPGLPQHRHRGAKTSLVCSVCHPKLFICSELCMEHHRSHIRETQRLLHASEGSQFIWLWRRLPRWMSVFETDHRRYLLDIRKLKTVTTNWAS